MPSLPLVRGEVVVAEVTAVERDERLLLLLSVVEGIVEDEEIPFTEVAWGLWAAFSLGLSLSWIPKSRWKKEKKNINYVQVI